MKTKILLATLAVFALPLTATATTIDLSADVTFQDLGSPSNPSPDAWQINNTSDSGASITSVTIDVSTATAAGTFFDTVNGGPGGGIGGGNGFAVTAGAASATDTGYTGVNNDFDGSTSITLLFSDFDAGESFFFFTDVDHDDGLIQDWLLSGLEFAGSTISVTFEGGFTSTTLLGTFTNNPGPPPFDASASVFASVGAVPEPGVLALLGLGLIGLRFSRKRS